jgi:hypothetical protein
VRDRADNNRKKTQQWKDPVKMQGFKLFRFLMKFLVVLSLMGIVSNCAQPASNTNVRPTQSASLSKATVPSTSATLPPDPTSIGGRAIPSLPHALPTIFVILMENHNWSDIAGNPSASYINNTLLPMSSYVHSYYNPPGIHPSEPNYLWLEAGTNFGVLNDNPPSFNHQSTSMHLVTLLDHAHLSWKSYQEDISGTVCPLDASGLYAPKHNPMVFFDDVTDTNNPQSSYCIAHERPYTELATDLQKNTVANYNFITPNLCDDMHNTCAPSNNSVQQGDTWLSQQIPLILASQAYRAGGVIFITWDEGEGSDGPIGMIVLSPSAKGKGYSNTLHYTHSSTLRTVEELLHVTPLLGDAANATDLSDLFQLFPISSP